MVVEAVEQAMVAHGWTGQALLVAVSGGVDSMVLLHALAELAPIHDLALEVAHVHHGLRGAEADRDAEAVERRARDLGLGFRLEHVAPEELREGRSNRERPTLQEAARTLRYEALRRMAGACGAVRVATAHTLDDQAETVLMRVLRGAGSDSLGGIPESSANGIVIRPLLRVCRRAIEDYAVAHGVEWREDASNRSDRYTRSRLRHHWLPGLAREFNPQLLRAIGRLAEAHRRDAEWIDEMVEEATNRLTSASSNRGGGLDLQPRGWSDLPEALARRVVRRMLVRMEGGRDLSHAHIVRVLAFLRRDEFSAGLRTLELPGGLRIDADHDGVRLYRIRD